MWREILKTFCFLRWTKQGLNRPRLGSWSIEQALSYSPVLHTNPSEKSTSTTRTRLRPTDVPKNLLWVRGSTIKGRCCLSHHTELRLVSMISFISRFPKDETLIQNKFLSQYSVMTDFIAFFLLFYGSYLSLSFPLFPTSSPSPHEDEHGDRRAPDKLGREMNHGRRPRSWWSARLANLACTWWMCPWLATTRNRGSSWWRANSQRLDGASHGRPTEPYARGRAR